LCWLLAASTIEVDAAPVAEAGEANRQIYAAAAEFVAAEDMEAAKKLVAENPSETLGRFVEWLTLSASTSRFTDILDFVTAHPDWPVPDDLRLKAEASMEPEYLPEDVVAYFSKFDPLSLAGVTKYRIALELVDKSAEGLSTVRNVWAGGSFAKASIDQLDLFVEQNQGLLRQRDHFARARGLLANRPGEPNTNLPTSRHAAKYVDSSDEKLVLTALQDLEESHDIERFDEVYSQWSKEVQDSELVQLVRLRAYRDNSDKAIIQRSAYLDEAIRVLNAYQEPQQFDYPWWIERRTAARQLLEEERPEESFQLVDKFRSRAKLGRFEGGFLAGWIGLRFLRTPLPAAEHFTAAREYAANIEERSLTHYWAGLAFAAGGEEERSQSEFEAAASAYFTFYGQLALSKLQRTVPTAPPLQEDDTAVDNLATKDLWEVYRALAGSKLQQARKLFGRRLVEKSNSLRERQLIGYVARKHADYSTAALSGSAANRRDGAIIPEGYPAPDLLLDLPAATMRNHSAVLLALIANESAFDQMAVSKDGAIGLMQILPQTGRGIAERIDVRFNLDQLSGDAEYNVLLGSAEFGRLLEKYDSLYPLVIAAYNAGDSEVDEWLVRYGDPRTEKITPLNWIESIPFRETRDFVRRVLQGAELYEAILEGRPLAIGSEQEIYESSF
jgi:soluble lytic murein transglycosylase